MSVVLRSQIGYDADAVSRDTALECKDPSLTVQSERDQTDINVMVKTFGRTGMLPQVTVPPTYQDFEGVFDFQSAMNLIVAAEASFNAMPAETRLRFGNDPAAFVDFCSNPDNLEEMRKMGLAVPRESSDVGVEQNDSAKAGAAAKGTSVDGVAVDRGGAVGGVSAQERA